MIPSPTPSFHYSGRPSSTPPGRLAQSSQTRSLGEVQRSFLCFNLQDEMMGMDLVNCICNYFLNYNCRVISVDRVHNIGSPPTKGIGHLKVSCVHYKVLLRDLISSKDSP